jgi:hypothetical protein
LQPYKYLITGSDRPGKSTRQFVETRGILEEVTVMKTGMMSDSTWMHLMQAVPVPVRLMTVAVVKNETKNQFFL